MDLHQSCGPSHYRRILDEVAILWSYLPSTSRAAMVACSTQLRGAVHNLSNFVIVMNKSDVKLLCKGSWPRLALIISLNLDDIDIEFELPRSLLLMAAMDWSQQGRKPAAMLVATHETIQACLHQQMTAAITYLRHTSWHQLTSITLSHCNLNVPHIIQELAADVRPSLFALKITGNVNDVAMEQLVPGAWPKLNTPNIQGDATADAKAMLTSVHSALPKLKCLVLTGYTLNSTCVASACCGLFKLNSLHLSKVMLPQEPCPCMKPEAGNMWKYLTIADSHMHDIAAYILFAAPMHKLSNLVLRASNITCDGVAMLNCRSLPNLDLLEISDSVLDEHAMSELSLGSWPSLQVLKLLRVGMDVDTLRVLTRGPWPNLRVLQLDAVMANAAVWDILQLHEKYLSLGSLPFKRTNGARRCEKLDSNTPAVIWKKLFKVTFVVPGQ